MSVHWVKADIAVASIWDLILTRECGHSSHGVGVVKSLELIGSGPVGLVHRQKVRFFQKKNPTASP